MRKQFITIITTLLLIMYLLVGCTQDTVENLDKNPPAEITNISVSNKTKKVVLSWTDPSDSDFTNVQITYSPGGGNPVLIDKGILTATFTDLTNDTIYTFTLKTVDKTGNKSAGFVQMAKPYKYNVYVSGFYYDQSGSQIVCYWENEIKKDLEIGYNRASIFKNGNDIYIAGGNGYWKNSERINFPDNKANVNAVAVINNHVYASGYYVNGTQVNGDTTRDLTIACYWKDGVKTDLGTGITDKLRSTCLFSIVYDGTDIYFSGFEETSSGHEVGCYWKNESTGKVVLNDGSSESGVFTLTKLDDSIYGYGRENEVCYWKNGIKNNVSSFTKFGGIYAYDIDIYLSGGYKKDTVITAAYLKNDTLYDLGDGVNDSHAAFSLFGSGSDIFIPGYQHNGNNKVACYWYNGIRIDLHTTSDSEACSIYAVLND